MSHQPGTQPHPDTQPGAHPGAHPGGQAGAHGGAQPATRAYRPGDVANGHVLTADGQWVPTGAAGAAGASSTSHGAGPKPKKPLWKRWWFVLGAIVLIIVVAASLGGGSEDGPTGTDDGAATQEEQAAEDATDDGASADEGPTDGATGDEAPADDASAEAAAPGIGETVADGKFEFVVTEVETGVERLGDDFLNDEAQGQFVLVHLDVRNIGEEAQYFDGSSQELLDSEGRTHSADGGAAIYLDDSNSFLNQINPGNEVQGVVVFDVPVDAELASITLHDSAFSGGVTVALG